MQTQNQTPSKKSSKSLIGIAVFLWMVNPGLLIPVGIGYGIYLLIRQITKAAAAAPQVRHSSPSVRQQSFDECPTGLFCFHRDKGEHHIRKGREIDPWDRPDIDISRYQRKR